MNRADLMATFTATPHIDEREVRTHLRETSADRRAKWHELRLCGNAKYHYCRSLDFRLQSARLYHAADIDWLKRAAMMSFAELLDYAERFAAIPVSTKGEAATRDSTLETWREIPFEMARIADWDAAMRRAGLKK